MTGSANDKAQLNITAFSPFTSHVSRALRKTAAFTLAEVLITLGIIGVVAAMTLPTLIQKNQDKELISRTKKIYSDINNSLLLVHKDYGVVGDNSYLFNSNDNSATVAQNWSKYFKGSKVCTNNSGKCKPYYYDIKFSTLWSDSEGNAGVYNNVYPKIILSNGAIIEIVTNRTGCEPKEYTGTLKDSYGRPIKNEDGTTQTFTYITDLCANIVFDVNGPKQPNQFGRDVYYFFVFKNKLQYNASNRLGGKSFGNILTGKDKLEYVNYTKGQKLN